MRAGRADEVVIPDDAEGCRRVIDALGYQAMGTRLSLY